MTICFVSGDTWEFDVELLQADGSPYELAEGDQVWFNVKHSYLDDKCLIAIKQESTHFKIQPPLTDLAATQYRFDVGIIFSNGDIYTAIPEGVLIIKNRVCCDGE